MADYNLGTARGRIVLDTSDVDSSADSAERSANRVKGSFESTAGAAGKAGGVLAVGAAAVAAGFGFAVKTAADFEKQVSAIAAVSGATGPELDAIREKALQLGKDTSFSASEAAAAMEELIKAGLTTEETLNGAADAAVALAAAGGVDIPTAATLAANAMNAFNLEAEDLNSVVDQIAGAANASAIDVGEFGQSLQQVGAVANLAGLSFEDTAVAIAQLGNAGIKGSDAGTSLKTFLSNLIPVTERQNGLFQELGLLAVDQGIAMKVLAEKGIKPVSTSYNDVIDSIEKYNEANGGAKAGTAKAATEALEYASTLGVVRNQFFDAQGNTKKLADIQGVLAEATKGMTKEQKLANLEVLFGSDAIRAAAVLADNGAKGYNELSKAMKGTTAAEVAAKRLDNLSGKFEQLKGSLETAAIVIGTALLPALKGIVDFVTSVVNAFLNLSPNTQKLILLFIGVATAVAGIIGVALLVGAAIATILPVLTALGAAIGVGAAAMGGILFIIPVIVAAIVVLAVVIYKNFDKIKSFVSRVWTSIKDFVVGALSAIGGFFKKIFGSIFGFFKTIFNAILAYWKFVFNLYYTVAKTVFEAILGIIKFVFNLYKTIITTVLGVVMALWKAFWGTFGEVIKAALGAMVSIIKLAFALITLPIVLAMFAITQVVKVAWDAVKFIFSSVLNFLVSLVTTVFNYIKTPIQVALNFIAAIFQRAFNFYRALFTSVFNFIKNIVMTVFNFVASFVRGAVDRIKAAINLLSVIGGIIAGFFQKAYDGVRDKVAAMISFVSQIGSRIKSAIGNLGSLLFDKGKQIIQGLLDGMTAMFGKIKDVADQGTKIIGRFIPGSPVKEGALKVLNNGKAGRLIMEMLGDGIANQAPQVIDTVSRVTEEIPLAVNGSQVPTPQQVVLPAERSQENERQAPQVNITVNNPIDEPTSVTTTKTLNRLALLEAV